MRECKSKFFCAIIIIPIICNVILSVNSFNIDLSNYTVYRSQDTSSMFGFAVTLHRDGKNRSWVLVGAPEGQSKFHQPHDTYRGGAVYKCKPGVNDFCVEIPFTREGNRVESSKQLDDRTFQWLGATLSASTRAGGPVLACAPRYIWHSIRFNRREPVGTCFVSDGDFTTFKEFSPCRTDQWGYHRQGTCQAGFSAAINKAGDRLYIGAPGGYYWQGQVFSIDAQASFSYVYSVTNKNYGAEGSSKAPLFSTKERMATDDDSYMGYSTVVGDFKQNEEFEGIAVGMPRGNNLKGKVLLFTQNLTNYKNLTADEQIGSYFGYSLTAADLNGDKLLDIIVGAPMYTDSNNELNYDEGRIYIFYQNNDSDKSFSSYQFIGGYGSKARFGHAVSTLADLNQDGYDDIAVGAPYGGPDGRGAVYIYHGSKQGINQNYVQVIYAEAVHTNTPLRTFGFSLAGGVDVDENGYPDLAVGAYLSGSVVLFRSRPVIFTNASVELKADEEKQINIYKKTCTLPNGQRRACTSINFCIKYTGKTVPPCIYLRTEYILDSDQTLLRRMGFLNSFFSTFNATTLLQKDVNQCTTLGVYVKNDIKDLLSPFEVEVKYFFAAGDVNSLGSPFSSLKPILNPPAHVRDIVYIKRNCRADGVCVPDLRFNITAVQENT